MPYGGDGRGVESAADNGLFDVAVSPRHRRVRYTRDNGETAGTACGQWNVSTVSDGAVRRAGS